MSPAASGFADMDARFLRVSQSQALPEQVTSDEYNGVGDYLAIFLGFTVFALVCMAVFRAYLAEAVNNREYVASLDDNDRKPRLPTEPGKPPGKPAGKEPEPGKPPWTNPWSAHNDPNDNVVASFDKQRERALENAQVKAVYPPEVLRKMGIAEGGFTIHKGPRKVEVEEDEEEPDGRLPSQGGKIPKFFEPKGEFGETLMPNGSSLYPCRASQQETRAIELGARPPVAKFGKDYVTDPKVKMRSQGEKPEEEADSADGGDNAIAKAMKSLSAPKPEADDDRDSNASGSAAEDDAQKDAAMAQLQQSSKDEIETESKQKPKRFAALPFTGVISPKATLLQIQQQEEEEEREAAKFRELARRTAEQSKQKRTKEELERLQYTQKEMDAMLEEGREQEVPMDEVERFNLTASVNYSKAEAAKWRSEVCCNDGCTAGVRLLPATAREAKIFHDCSNQEVERIFI
jgi:hypothetical protein